MNNENGHWRETDEAVQHVITSYFEDMFSSRAIGERLSNRFQFGKIYEEQGQELEMAVSAEEVKSAVFAMYSDKSPGLMV